jgi:hypothetical protein
MALLGFTDRDSAPPLGGADDGCVHQLQHRALAERVRNDRSSGGALRGEGR